MPKLFSTENTLNQKSIDDVRRDLLATALTLVPEHSFSDRALADAAAMLELPGTARALAPNGPRDIVEHLFAEGLATVREEHRLLRIGITRTITHLSRKRLEYMSPYITRWPDAVRLLAHPRNVPFAVHHLHQLVDEMWYLAGDRSFDSNYYTKRALLAGVYSSTELYMTTDTSPGFANTWAFLDHRFKDSAKVGKAAAEIKSTVEWGAMNLKGILASVRST
ncbi:COQ9-domain-containing protein [Blastocladiella britannica]|nr:COQ9-domain-containing protein [Blastocladiella britannica]